MRNGFGQVALVEGGIAQNQGRLLHNDDFLRLADHGEEVDVGVSRPFGESGSGLQ
jgi:hypothetical protein